MTWSKYLPPAGLLLASLLTLSACGERAVPGPEQPPDPEPMAEETWENPVTEGLDESTRALLETPAAAHEPSSPEESGGAQDPQPEETRQQESPPFHGRSLSMGERAASPLFQFEWAMGPGTQEQLEQWYALVRGATPAALYVASLKEEDAAGFDLTAQQADNLLEALREAPLQLYADREDMGNPTTGGSCVVAAADDTGSRLWAVIYDGYWFTVSLDDGALAVFNGSACQDTLFDALDGL